MTGQRIFRINTQFVASQIFDSEAVIINLGNGMVYTLDGVGAEVWRRIEHGHGLRSISIALAARYTVSAEDALADLEDLAQEMLDEELIIEESGSKINEENLAIERLNPLAPYRKPELVKDSEMREVLALDPPLPRLEPGGAGLKSE